MDPPKILDGSLDRCKLCGIQRQHHSFKPHIFAEEYD